MKDSVFIAWCGSKDVAFQVKNILETEHNYRCIVGGNSDNASSLSTVGDTVIQQLKNCNQAIVIFQNNANGEVSDNLFFEVGYALASYGQKKVHCVRMKDEKIALPSDFDNAFVEPIDCDGTTENFAAGIVEYFSSRQKLSVNENKILLINNRYMIHEKIESHYSNAGSKCSDYELAQYILYYMQAAQMFDDVYNVHREMVNFKQKHIAETSKELRLAVEICISFFEIVLNVKENPETNEAYIDEDAFFDFKQQYDYYKRNLPEKCTEIFYIWAETFVNEHMAFGYMLFGNNESLNDGQRRKAYEKCIESVEASKTSIKKIEKLTSSKENHDDTGILALMKAYISRNMYVAKKYLGEEGAIDWLKESAQYRELLKNTYGKGAVDTQIYNNFCMEYYLAIVNWVEAVGTDAFDEFDVIMYKRQIKDYLKAIELSNSETAYLHKIKTWSER